MKKQEIFQYVLLGLACVLLILTTVQAVQVNKINTPTVQAQQQQSPVANTPLQPAPVVTPTMVGGC